MKYYLKVKNVKFHVEKRFEENVNEVSFIAEIGLQASYLNGTEKYWLKV